MVFSALGGCWWPLEIMPRTAQIIGWFFPTYWAMKALHGVVTFGRGFEVDHRSGADRFGIRSSVRLAWSADHAGGGLTEAGNTLNNGQCPKIWLSDGF